MVLNYFQLAEQPFGVTPDPRFLYLSATHREAVASVFYSVNAGRGFTALIAEPGMGKTTVLFNLLQLMGTAAKTAFLFQAQDTPKNFLRHLLLDLGVEDDGQDLVRMQLKLNDCLVRETSQGKHFIVVIDEAQNLDEPILEMVRMLSNFETPREKLMHIILAGQPQLAAKLGSPQLTQLRQRISIVARLTPFTESETRAYIEHRLRIAGYSGQTALFTDRAVSLIAQYSGGIPRNINNICFNSMSLACAMKHKTISASSVEEVLRDLDLAPLRAMSPAVDFHPRSKATPEKLFGRVTAVIPKGWKLRAGVVVLGAMLLTGIGFGVVAKNPRSADTLETSRAKIVQPITPSGKADLGSGDTRTSDFRSTNSASDRDGLVSPGVSVAVANVSNSVTGINQNTSRSHDFEVVRLGPEDTVYSICLENLGRYDAQVVALIKELNPGLRSPRHLRTGQEIRIPTPGKLFAQSNPSTKRFVNGSALEAKKP
jgi:general secretion pathway protein A